MVDNASGRVGKAMSPKPTMNAREKSDGSVVPMKSSNDAAITAEEMTEGRGPAKGNTDEHTVHWTQSRRCILVSARA